MVSLYTLNATVNSHRIGKIHKWRHPMFRNQAPRTGDADLFGGEDEFAIRAMREPEKASSL